MKKELMAILAQIKHDAMQASVEHMKPGHEIETALLIKNIERNVRDAEQIAEGL